MTNRLTISDLNQKLKDGKIIGYSETKKAVVDDKKGSGIVVRKKTSKAKECLSNELELWCKKNYLHLRKEYKFNSERKWRFDFCIERLRIAIEFEGGVYMNKSGHSNAKGQTRDIEKYNSAQALGWKVIRFNAVNYKTLITELEKHIL